MNPNCSSPVNPKGSRYLNKLLFFLLTRACTPSLPGSAGTRTGSGGCASSRPGGAYYIWKRNEIIRSPIKYTQ